MGDGEESRKSEEPKKKAVERKRSAEPKKSTEPKPSKASEVPADERLLDRLDTLVEEFQEFREEVSDRLGSMAMVMEQWWDRECRRSEEANDYRAAYNRAGPAGIQAMDDVEMGEGGVVAEGSGQAAAVVMEDVVVGEGSGPSAVADESSADPSAPAA